MKNSLLSESVQNSNPLKIISITSGKGGVGKTTISVNLALTLSRMQQRVLLFDADLGLANVDILFGLKAKKNISDFLAGNCELSEICIQCPNGISIVPGASGLEKLANLTKTEVIALIHAFSELNEKFDMMLIDLGAGISHQVMNITHASQDVMLVICNDPASFMDSYAVIKILHQQYKRNRFGVVVNKVKDNLESEHVFSRFHETTTRFMNVNLQYLGYIPQDEMISFSARERIPVVEQFPGSKAVQAFQKLGTIVLNWNDSVMPTGGVQFFLERLTEVC